MALKSLDGMRPAYLNGFEHEIDFFEPMGAIAGVAGFEKLEKACGFAGDSLALPEMFTATAEFIDKVAECTFAFISGASSLEKTDAVRGVLVGAVERVGAVLSLRQFFRDVQGMREENGTGMAIDVIDVIASVNSIIDSSKELIELAAEEVGHHTDYEQHVDAMTRQKNVWEIVKDTASLVGGVIGIAGVIAGFAISSWITLAVAMIVFVGSVVAFWMTDELARYQHDHVVEQIRTQLSSK